MLDEGTRLLNVGTGGRASAQRVSVSGVAALIIGIALLSCPGGILAQHGGGGGRGMSTGAPSGANPPHGVNAKDDLKDFHRIMAVQATAQQKAAFASVLQDAQAASEQLKAFREGLSKTPASSALSDRATTLDQAIEKARTGNQSFLASFSPAQKSGLKDITKKLLKADSDLDKQIQELGQIVQTPKSDPQVRQRTDRQLRHKSRQGARQLPKRTTRARQ